MTPQPVPARIALDRILGPGIGLADVAAAFSGSLEPEYRYRWTARASLRGEIIAIEGEIVDGEIDVGRFARRLLYEREAAHAQHEILEIARSHRRFGIALAQYRACFAFYERIGIRTVRLDADGMGIYVWPSFGFDLTRRSQRERLRALLRRHDVSPLPPAEMLLAPRVVDMVPDGDLSFGSRIMEAFGQACRESHEAVPMSLDLSCPAQRELLALRGILPMRLD